MSRFIIDIDGVIGKKLKWSKKDIELRQRDMFLSIEPDKKIITRINCLYLEDHTIILHTSRLWHDFEVTTNWLEMHGVKYHTLVMAKPIGDFYVDDHNLSVKEFLETE